MLGAHQSYQDRSIWNGFRSCLSDTAVPPQGSYALVAQAQQTDINSSAVRAPSRGLLQAIGEAGKKAVTSLPGRLVGSYSLKCIAGALMGLGTAACIAGGAGVPLIVVGAVLFFVSTSFSLAAVRDKSPETLVCHLIGSAFAGGAGFLVACMATATFDTGFLPGLLAPIAEGIILALPFIADDANFTDYRLAELASRDGATEDAS